MLGTLGSSLGLITPSLGPIGAAIGATVGGVTAYQRAGERIDSLKKLQAQRMAKLTQSQSQMQESENENTQKPLQG